MKMKSPKRFGSLLERDLGSCARPEGMEGEGGLATRRDAPDDVYPDETLGWLIVLHTREDGFVSRELNLLAEFIRRFSVDRLSMT